MGDLERQLDNVFQAYREACPTPEASRNFGPDVWARIDSRRTFSFVFAQYARMGAAVAALLCVFLLVLTQMTGSHVPATAPVSTYADALAADQTAEATYYAEAVSTPEYQGGGSRP